MLYLQTDVLDEINAHLTCLETHDSNVFGRLELFKCSSKKCDRRLRSALEERYKEDQHQCVGSPHHEAQLQHRRHSLSMAADAMPIPHTCVSDHSTADVASVSPPTQGHAFALTRPFGHMQDVQSRKTLFYLISTLNMAFPDYDFSSVKPEHFTKHQLTASVSDIHATFFRIGGEQFASYLSRKLWTALDEMIGPNAPAVIETHVVKFADPLAAATHLETTESKKSASLPVVDIDTEAQHHPKSRTRKSSWATHPAQHGHLWDGPQGWENEVAIYTYEPNEATGAGDPYEDETAEDCSGTLWSFYYFFFNKRLKRLVFFTMHGEPMDADAGSTTACSQSRASESGGQMDDETEPVLMMQTPLLLGQSFVPVTPSHQQSSPNSPPEIHVQSSFMLPFVSR